jgi:multiple sugar transport system permease protein
MADAVIPRAKGRPFSLQQLEGYVYILPTILGLLIFSAGAVAMAFGISLTNYESLGSPKFIGLNNYLNVIVDPVFPQVVLNSAYYTVAYVPANLVLGLLLASLANRSVRGITFFRSVYFLPVVTSGVAVSLMFTWLFNSQFGPINEILYTVLGIQGPGWLTSTEWAMPTIAIVAVWKGLGYTMVLFLAGLQDVPGEVYEAGRIDGAGSFALFRSITLPLLTPTIFFVLIISIISSFQVFDFVFVMTQGGPANSTTTLAYWIYENAFQWFHLGYASAIAFVLFGIVLVFTLIQWRVQRRWVFYQ